uniref:Uncharacterized protein n=1 Tax=Strigamia maritima TaxID=126957 RepID=T1JFY4_STRMM
MCAARAGHGVELRHVSGEMLGDVGIGWEGKMALSKRIKEQTELMEIRLQKLKEAMVREKEERRRFMETRWKSTRLLKKTNFQPQIHENIKFSTLKAESNKQDDKTKRFTRKQEKCIPNKLNASKSLEGTAQNYLGLGITCSGSLLHSRSVSSTFKPGFFQKQMRRYEDSVTCISPSEAQSSDFEDAFNEGKKVEEFKILPLEAQSSDFDDAFDEEVHISSSDALSSHFDGKKIVEEVETADFACQESKSLQTSDKKGCSDKESDPLVPEAQKFDFSCLIESYESALLSGNKVSNELTFWNEDKESIKSVLSDDKPLFELNDNQFDDVKENLESKCVDFESIRSVAAATGLRKVSTCIEIEEPILNLQRKSSIQVTELETMPLEQVVDGQKWILPNGDLENVKLIGKVNASQSSRDSQRSCVTITPIFDNNLLLPQETTSSMLKSHDKWDLLTIIVEEPNQLMSVSKCAQNDNSQGQLQHGQRAPKQDKDDAIQRVAGAAGFTISELDFGTKTQNGQDQIKIEKETVPDLTADLEVCAIESVLEADLIINIVALEDQINAINGDEELDNGDRFDDKAAVASLD